MSVQTWFVNDFQDRWGAGYPQMAQINADEDGKWMVHG
jgi:hypothetical protein